MSGVFQGASSFYVLVFGFLLSSPSSAWERCEQALGMSQYSGQVQAHLFDVDGNLFRTDDRLYLQRVSEKAVHWKVRSGALTQGEVVVSQAVFDEIAFHFDRDTGEGREEHWFRDIDGKKHSVRGLFLNRNGSTGTFRDFGDRRDGDHFRRMLKRIVATDQFRGPMWEKFVLSLSTPLGALNTYILTARFNHPYVIWLGLRDLQAAGLIRHIPPMENIWSVSSPYFPKHFENVFGTSQAQAVFGPERVILPMRASRYKFEVMSRLMGVANRQELNGCSALVESVDAAKMERLHTFVFSDNELRNIEAAREGLQKLLNQGKLNRVKAMLLYTGEEMVRGMVLVPHQEPRAMTLSEIRKATGRRKFRADECSKPLGTPCHFCMTDYF